MDAQNQRSPFSNLSEEDRRALSQTWGAQTPQAKPQTFSQPSSTLNESEREYLSKGWGAPSSSIQQLPQGTNQTPRPTTGQDILYSGVSGIASGVPKLLGLPGLGAYGYVSGLRSASTPTEQTVDGTKRYYVPSMAPGAGGQMREISPERASSMQWESGPNIVERALSLFTPKSLESLSKTYIPHYSAVAEYKPATVPGKFAKAIGEELPMATIPGGTLAQRVMGAAGSGAGAQAVRSIAGDKAPSPWEEAAGALFGGLTGALSPQIIKGAVSPFTRSAESAAESTAATALKQELATASPDRAEAIRSILKEAAETGVSPENVMPISLLGKDTLKRLTPKISTNPATIDEVNQQIRTLYQNAPQNAARDVAALVGRPSPIIFTQEQAFLADMKNAINNPNYSRVMSSPRAASIPNDMYGHVTNYALFKEHLPKIMASVEPLRYRYGISAPDFRRNRPGNLAFWDSAKKYFDNLGNVEKSQNESFREIARQIRDASDIAVPAYASTRDKAAELLGYENAFKLGYDLVDMSNKKLAAGGQKLYRNLETMTPSEKSNLAVGMVGRLTDMMIPANNSADVTKLLKFVNNPETIRRLSYSFTPDEITKMYGTAARNALIAKAPLIPIGTESAVSMPLAGGTIFGLGSLAANFLTQQAIVDPTYMHVAAVALGSALGQAKSSAQKRAAEKLVEYLGNPEKTVELGRLLTQSSEARNIYARLNKSMSDDAGYYIAAKSQSAVQEPEKKPSEPRPLTITPDRTQRASGGRINPSAMADRIIGQIEKARRDLQSQTGGLLKHDDETIVKALKVANERI